jgi:outer membrane protein assembly factor BamA
MRRQLRLAALAGWILAAPCVAGAQSDTSAGAAQAAREAKAAHSAVYEPGKVERFLMRLESGAFNRLFVPADGFGVRIGGIDDGAGFALGGGWRNSQLWGGHVTVSMSAARSIGGDSQVDAGVGFPQVGTHRLSLGVDASSTRLAQQRFFGPGAEARVGDETSFGAAADRVDARATVSPASWLNLSASTGVLNTETLGGRARRVPSLETRFTPTEAAGFGDALRFTTWSVGATVDYRDVPGNPRGGGRYYIAASRYTDTNTARYSFTRIDAEAEQHLSAWKRQRLITLRAMLASTVADDGAVAPFHLQPTLGGSRWLRGFERGRFRDRHVVGLQAEYGWDVLPFLNAVAFVEAGAAASRLQDLDTRSLRTDYGFGLRFGSARTVALRTDVAFGSGEGTRFTMRFGHAF